MRKRTRWMYQGKRLKQLPAGAVGFLYLIIAADGRFYIGQTVADDWRTYWGSGEDLKAYYREHGKDGTRRYALRFYDDIEELNAAEKHLVAITGAQTSDRYFNQREGGGNGGRHSEATRQKMSRTAKGRPGATKGRPLAESHKRAIGDANRLIRTGSKLSAEHCRNIGKAHTGMKRSAATKERMRIAATGRNHTPETCEKLRQINLDQKHSEETKQKMSRAHTGKKKSAATRRNMSEAQKLRYQKKPISAETRRKMSIAAKKREAKKKGRPQAASRFMSVEMTIPI